MLDDPGSRDQLGLVAREESRDLSSVRLVGDEEEMLGVEPPGAVDFNSFFF